MLYYIKNSLKSIMINKTRTLLIVLCFAVGVFSLLIISAASKTGRELINSQLDSLGLYGLSIRFEEYSNNSFTDKDIEILTELDEIKTVMPIVARFQTVESNGSRDNCVIWGVDNNAIKILDLNVVIGSCFTKEDVLSRNRKCLVSEGYALEKYGTINVVGRNIELILDGNNYEFTICGVTTTGTADLRQTISSFIPHFVYVNNSALTDISGTNPIERLAIEPADNIESTVAGNKAKKLLEIKYNGQYSFIIEDVDEQLGKVDTVMDTVSIVLSIVASIAMVITGMSIMSVMMLSVNERKREIAIKKSIGATKIRIISEFICEAILIAFVGCLVGTLAALFLIIVLNIIGINVTISIADIISTELFAILTGIIFGVYPATKAAEMKPIDGLKNE